MIINANTKIGSILKENKNALEAIVSLNPKFQKLRNPLLRKLMAGRTSLAMASKIGGVSINEFFNKLETLGFKIDRAAKEINQEIKHSPNVLKGLSKDKVIELDVRPLIASGRDPLNVIMQKLKTVKQGEVLKIINSFEPTPLILMLRKKGYDTYVDRVDDQQVDTYFFKPHVEIEEKAIGITLEDWDEAIQRFGSKIKAIDVRELEMPGPMHKILESLEILEDDTALYVYHKRIPVYLLPELVERGFEYRFREIKESEVHLLIWKMK